MASIEEERDVDRAKRICYSKVKHKTYLSAEYALNEMTRLPHSAILSIYKCSICKNYHIGKDSSKKLKKKKNENNSKTLLHNNSNSTDIDDNNNISIFQREQEI